MRPFPLRTTGERVKALRERNQWTVREFSRACGLDKDTIRRIENEPNDQPGCKERTLQKIAAVVGVRVQYLRGYEDSEYGLEDAISRQSLRVYLDSASLDRMTESILWQIADDSAGPRKPEEWKRLTKYVRPAQTASSQIIA